MILWLVTTVLMLSFSMYSGGTTVMRVAKFSTTEHEFLKQQHLRLEQGRRAHPIHNTASQSVPSTSSHPANSDIPLPSWSYNRLPGTHDDDSGHIHYDAGSQTIYFLSFRKDKSVANYSTLFVSRNMGETIDVVSVQHNNKAVHFSKLYTSNGVVIAFSESSGVAAISSDKGLTWKQTEFDVGIKTFIINEKFPKYILAIGVKHTAYLSSDAGIEWKHFQNEVLSAVWSQHSTFLYYLKSGHEGLIEDDLQLFRVDVRFNFQATYLSKSISEIGTFDDIMYAKRNTPHELFVSFKDEELKKCEFPNKLNISDLTIRAATEKELFVIVRTQNNSIFLYSGLLFDLKFVKTNSDIGEFDSFFNVTCVNLETFRKLPGVVITNADGRKTSGSGLGPYTAISFSHGSRWNHLIVPGLVNGKKCDWPQCRLLLHLECSNFMGKEVAEIAERAPHLMIAHGVIVNGTKKTAYGMYISDDAGLNWRMASTSFQEFFVLNDGGAILTFPRFGRGAYFSYDFGMTWKSIDMVTDTFRVIRALNDHSGTFMVASAIGYDETTDEWVFIKIDFSRAFQQDCQPSDYNYFTPGSGGNMPQCFQGAKNFIYRRRHNVICRSIIDKLPVLNSSTCPCKKEDFGCSFGHSLKDGICVNDPDHETTNQTCNLGEFVFSDSSYVKLHGDSCIASRTFTDEEANICQFKNTDDTLTVMLGNTFKYAHLSSSDSFNLSTLPVKVLSPQVPVAFDIDHKSRCLYYLNSSGIVKSCWTTREEAFLGKEIFVVRASGLLNLEFEHLGRNIYYYTRNKVSVVNADSSYTKDVYESTGDIIFVEVFHNVRCMLVYSISNEEGKLKHSVLKLSLLGSVIVTIEAPERIVAAAMNDTRHIILFSAEWEYQYKSDGSSYSKTKLNDKNVIHVRLDKERRVVVTDAFIKINKKITFFPLIKDVDFYFASDLANNPCSVSNCKYFCFPTGDHSYTCDCPTNMTLEFMYDCVCDDKHQGCMDCTPNEFQCDTNECMDKSVRCNGVDNCGDNSDEKGCTHNCTNDEFQCHDKIRCVNVEAMCNGFKDCPDGSDEIDCPTVKACNASQFMCFKGTCIPSAKRCNGIDDCGDSSDEESCEVPGCRKGEVKCKNGQCILPIQVCNGVFDCLDWSDEQGCDANEGSDKKKVNCSLKCNDKCILDDQVCDHYMDCPSGEDEMDCNDSFSCPANGYTKCASTAECYERARACNGFPDCSDASDEFNCSEFNKCKLPEKFICSSDNSCITPNQYCDGNPDCSDNSDEPPGCSEELMVTLLEVSPTNNNLTSISWGIKTSDFGKLLNVTLIPWDVKKPKLELTSNGTKLEVQGLGDCEAYTVIIKAIGAKNGRSLQFVTRHLNPGVPLGISYNSRRGMLSWDQSKYPCQPSQYHVSCGSGGKELSHHFVSQNRVYINYNSSINCMISSCPLFIFNFSCSEFSRSFQLAQASRGVVYVKIFLSILLVVGIISLTVLLFKQRKHISCERLKNLFARDKAASYTFIPFVDDRDEILQEDDDNIDIWQNRS